MISVFMRDKKKIQFLYFFQVESVFSVGIFSRQCRASDLTGGDSLEENPLEQKGKNNPDETSKDIRECHKAFLSSRDTKMLGMSEANQASGNLITADSGHIT